MTDLNIETVKSGRSLCDGTRQSFLTFYLNSTTLQMRMLVNPQYVLCNVIPVIEQEAGKTINALHCRSRDMKCRAGSYRPIIEEQLAGRNRPWEFFPIHVIKQR